jgi:hypothetical protein
MCDFVGAPLNAPQLHPMIDYINSVTGWNVSLYELRRSASAATRLPACSTTGKASRRTTPGVSRRA